MLPVPPDIRAGVRGEEPIRDGGEGVTDQATGLGPVALWLLKYHICPLTLSLQIKASVLRLKRVLKGSRREIVLFRRVLSPPE